jgi:hypothetical protein
VATPRFTIHLQDQMTTAVKRVTNGQEKPLMEVKRPLDLVCGTWCRANRGVTACFDLPRGDSLVELRLPEH